MAKPAHRTKTLVTTLAKPTSPAALISIEAEPSVRALAGGAVEVAPHDLVEFQPRPLEFGIREIAGAERAGVRFYRVANASEDLPPVPITYDVRKRTWLLMAEYSLTYQGHTLTAHEGYSFDLSSVPRALWWLIAPNELSIVAPLFHDLLYEYRGRLPADGYVVPYRTYTRLEVDDLFLYLMEQEGVPWFRRHAAYSAVRAAGGVAWAP